MKYEPLVIETWVGADGRPIRLQVIRLASGGLGVSLTSQPGAHDLDGLTVTVAGQIGQDATAYKLDNKSCTVESGSEGWINFQPTAAELDTAGRITCQLRVFDDPAVEYSDLFYIEVGTPLYNAG